MKASAAIGLNLHSKGARATHSGPHVRPLLRVFNFSECMSHFVHVEKRLLYCTYDASVNQSLNARLNSCRSPHLRSGRQANSPHRSQAQACSLSNLLNVISTSVPCIGGLVHIPKLVASFINGTSDNMSFPTNDHVRYLSYTKMLRLTYDRVNKVMQPPAM